MNIEETLAATAAATKKEKKSPVPVVEATQEMIDLATTSLKLSKKIDSLTSEKKVVDKELVDLSEPLYEEYCAERGYVKSVKVPSTGVELVTITWKDSFYDIPLEKEAEIKTVIGEERYKEDIEKKIVLTFDQPTMDIVEKIMKALGKDFEKVAKVKFFLGPTERYSKELYVKYTPDEREKLKKLIPRYAAAVKTK